MNQRGQALLIILLATLVALSIALSLTQKSQSDLASSNRGDQSSRALSAAEAGIEKALTVSTPISNTNYIDPSVLKNQSSVAVKSTGLVPIAADESIEYPAIDKISFSQYWLTGYPANRQFDLYFGDPIKYSSNCNTATCPAIAVTLIIDNGGIYQFINKQFDSNSTRAGNNGFTAANCSGAPDGSAGLSLNKVYTLNSADFTQPTTTKYFCKARFPVYIGTPVLLRIRPLYADLSLKTALTPDSGQSLPSQAIYYSATGTSGQSKRTVRMFTQKDVVPFFFDYAIFSNGNINKN